MYLKNIIETTTAVSVILIGAEYPVPGTVPRDRNNTYEGHLKMFIIVEI
jgi:hypothetical protein